MRVRGWRFAAEARGRGGRSEQQVQQRHRGEDDSEDGSESQTARGAVRPTHRKTPEARQSLAFSFAIDIGLCRAKSGNNLSPPTPQTVAPSLPVP